MAAPVSLGVVPVLAPVIASAVLLLLAKYIKVNDVSVADAEEVVITPVVADTVFVETLANSVISDDMLDAEYDDSGVVTKADCAV